MGAIGEAVKPVNLTEAGRHFSRAEAGRLALQPKGTPEPQHEGVDELGLTKPRKPYIHQLQLTEYNRRP